MKVTFNEHSYCGLRLRVIALDGQVWFLGRDIAKALEYQTAKDIVRSLDDDENWCRKLSPEGRMPMLCVSLRGLYVKLATSHSKKFIATRRFIRWAEKELLPLYRDQLCSGSASEKNAGASLDSGESGSKRLIDFDKLARESFERHLDEREAIESRCEMDSERSGEGIQRAGQDSEAPMVFHFGECEVRTVILDEQVWFVASDIAKALDFKHAPHMVRMLDDDEKGVHNVDTSSQNRHGAISRQVELTIINESGLYNAILKSRKPEAKKFRRWVTSEVLPAIRKHGKYEHALAGQKRVPHSEAPASSSLERDFPIAPQRVLLGGIEEEFYDAQELYDLIGYKEVFSSWWKRRCADLSLMEGRDFIWFNAWSGLRVMLSYNASRAVVEASRLPEAVKYYRYFNITHPDSQDLFIGPGKVTEKLTGQGKTRQDYEKELEVHRLALDMVRNHVRERVREGIENYGVQIHGALTNFKTKIAALEGRVSTLESGGEDLRGRVVRLEDHFARLEQSAIANSAVQREHSAFTELSRKIDSMMQKLN